MSAERDATGSQVVRTRTGDVDVLDTGGAGNPVLFVHGSPGGCDQGVLMTRFLVAAGLRLVCVSRPGYLRTPLTADTATPAQQAELLLALMDQLGVPRFGLMSWSGGGPASYLLAGRAPERVTALVQCASVSKAYEWDLGGEDRLMLGRLGELVVTEMARHTPKQLVATLLSAEGHLTKEQARALTEHVTADPAKQQFVLDLARTVPRRRTGLDNDIQQFPHITDLGLPRVQAPTLLVHGTADSDVPPDHSDHALAELPAAELLRVESGTHVCVWTDYTSADIQQRIIEKFRTAARC